MLISSESAMAVAREISSIIGHDVNMMDARGVIIASTDALRIGTFHAGAERLLREHLDELMIAGDDEYEGSRPGINLPIVFDQKVVGVVGVTGEREEVERYGRVIKKMTEILLLESWVEGRRKMRAEVLNGFVEEWLFGSGDFDEAFVDRGRQIGIDVTLPRQVLIAGLSPVDIPQDSNDAQTLSHAVEEAIAQTLSLRKNSAWHRTAFQFTCLVPAGQEWELKELARDMVEQSLHKAGTTLVIGIDDSRLLPGEIRVAYGNATKAYQAALTDPSSPMKLFSELYLELFVNEVPRQTRRLFIDKVFKGCNSPTKRRFETFLKVFFKCGCSVRKTAASLIFHKNTIEYKLRKIAEKTGLDPRRVDDAGLFSLAMAFDASLDDKTPLQAARNSGTEKQAGGTPSENYSGAGDLS